MAFNIISLAMTMLKHRDSIAKIVDVLPDLKKIFDELTPGQPQPPPPPSGYEPGHEIGSMSWLQESLNALGADPQLDVDGEYGPATNKAVSEYQNHHDIKVDGWAGPETVSSILEELDKLGATG
jgi:peptidoglycan hydrolase-like protein with peptidoglycan-binding domain